MNATTIKLLAICGSLRPGSSNEQIIQEAARLVRGNVEWINDTELAGIPAFDGSDPAPETVLRFRNAIRSADGVFICSPEYAFGVPGALKNALDWTVSSGEWVGKPVALVTAATSGTKAHASLLDTLSALSADWQEDRTLLISFVRSKLKLGRLTDDATQADLERVLSNLVIAAGRSKMEAAGPPLL